MAKIKIDLAVFETRKGLLARNATRILILPVFTTFISSPTSALGFRHVITAAAAIPFGFGKISLNCSLHALRDLQEERTQIKPWTFPLLWQLYWPVLH